MRRRQFTLAVMGVAAIAGCTGGTGTDTASPTRTDTATEMPTATDTATGTASPTSSPTSSSTDEPTPVSPDAPAATVRFPGEDPIPLPTDGRFSLSASTNVTPETDLTCQLSVRSDGSADEPPKPVFQRKIARVQNDGRITWKSFDLSDNEAGVDISINVPETDTEVDGITVEQG